MEVLVTFVHFECPELRALYSFGPVRLVAATATAHQYLGIPRYRLIGLGSGSFLLRDYKITKRWEKVFLKALVERNSVMVEAFYMISIPQKYDQKHII